MSSMENSYTHTQTIMDIFQYTMLSGRAPFQSRSKDDTSASIIARIKDGSFDMSGPEWISVSSQAKKLIKGK